MAVDDATVVQRLAALLQDADLQQTTEKMLRKQLEEQLGADLADKKKLIRAEVEKYLNAQDGAADGDGDDDDYAEEDDDEDEAPRGKRGRQSGGGGSGGGGGGFGTKLCNLSPELQAFLGVEQLPRTQVVKQIWAYVKANDLQDPANKRNFILDAKMKTIFSGPTNMFNMNKQLTKHIWNTDTSVRVEGGGGSSGSRAAKKQKTAAGGEGAKRGGGGFTAPVRLTPELAAFVGAPVMSRPQLTKFFNEYFNAHDLKDPSNKQWVVSDAALKQLLGRARFRAFGELSKLLKPHILGMASREEVEAAGVEAGGGGAAAGNGEEEEAVEEEGAAAEEAEEGAGAAAGGAADAAGAEAEGEAAGVKAEAEAGPSGQQQQQPVAEAPARDMAQEEGEQVGLKAEAPAAAAAPADAAAGAHENGAAGNGMPAV